MKKLLLCMLGLLVLTGCGKENVKLNLNKISNELSSLTSNEIDIPSIDVSNMEEFDNLEGVYDYDFEEVLGLDPELIEQYNVNYNSKEKQVLAIFKPFEGKKEEVKEQLKDFMEKLEAKLEEVNGLLVYISSSDNEKVLNKLKETKTPVFGMLMEVKKDQIKDVLNIEENVVEEFLMKMPMMMTQSSTFIIVKPVSGQEDTVATRLNEYMDKLEIQWSNYLPDQYELVKNRKVEKIGDYLVYIVSNNNDLVFNTINNNKIAE